MFIRYLCPLINFGSAVKLDSRIPVHGLINHAITIIGLPFQSKSYLHDEASVDEPRSLRDAEVGAAELHQAVVVQNLKGKARRN